MKTVMKAGSIIVGALSLSAFGYLSGWVVGASNTPVVAAFLPLLFGLVTVFVTSLISNVKARQELGTVRQTMKKAQALGELSALKQEPVAVDIFTYITIGSSLILLFCIATFIGIEQGTNVRSPNYQFTVADLAPNAEQISPEEDSLIYRIILDMQSKGISEAKAESMLKQTVGRLYSAPNKEVDKRARLRSIADNLMNVSSTINRGPRAD